MTNEEYKKKILEELEKIDEPETLEFILELIKRLQD